MMKMSSAVQEQSHGMDEGRQHPKMPPTLKKIERELEEMLACEPLNYSQKMQKVPPVLRLANGSNDYDPMVVALGPYHHGKPKLQAAEAFKSKALQHIIIDTGKSMQFFFDEVFKRVDDVKSNYAEDPKKKYSDSVFAQMMLLDACFVISYILAPAKQTFASTILSAPSGDSAQSAHSGDSAQSAPSGESISSGDSAQSGPSGDSTQSAPFGDSVHFDFATIYRDMLLLENQIPLWFLKLVNYLAYDSEAVDLVDVFIYKFSDFPRNKRKERASYNQDSHFLDAYRRALLWERDTSVRSCCKFRFGWPNWTDKLPPLMTSSTKENCDDSTPFHSASDLIAKGIRFKPSRDNSLTGLCFKSGFFSGQLQLPLLHVSTHTRVLFSNLIAHENCVKFPTEPKVVAAYIKFVKSLILRTNDVEELRANGILFTSLGTDEEVVKIIKELNTSTRSTEKAFEDMEVEIQKHLKSKFKSYLGEFLDAYFLSYFTRPWAFVSGFFTGILLLLTVVQTTFTVVSRN